MGSECGEMLGEVKGRDISGKVIVGGGEERFEEKCQGCEKV